VSAAQADNPQRCAGFGEDQSMKVIADITDGEKAVFAVAAGRHDHGRGPIEFVGEREWQASFPDVLCIFRQVELDLHCLIVDTNKWTVNDNGLAETHAKRRRLETFPFRLRATTTPPITRSFICASVAWEVAEIRRGRNQPESSFSWP